MYNKGFSQIPKRQLDKEKRWKSKISITRNRFDSKLTGLRDQSPHCLYFVLFNQHRQIVSYL